MNIVFLSFYSGVVYRGVETYVHELSNALIDLGHNVTVYQNGPSYSGARYKTISLKIPFKLLNNGNFAALFNQFSGAFAVGIFTIKSLMHIKSSPEVLVATNNRLQVLVARIFTFFKRIKLVIPGQGGPGIDERFALWCFPDLFIPLSEYQRSWAKKANPFVSTSSVIHNGVNLKKFGGQIKPYIFDLEKPIILYVAAFWPLMKRQHLLIKAVSKLKKGSLVLAGDGEGKEALLAFGKKLLGNRFFIKSFNYDEMPGVYKGVDIFSMPTVSWESFGIVMVEAMASNLPVVATDDPIRREIVGDAGLFVDPNDADKYATSLEEALNLNWGNIPRKRAEEFSWDKIAEQYESLFQGLSGKP